MFATHYDLLRCIGRGGMGEVFEAIARGEAFERRVAIKRMHADLGTEPTALQMFFDEATIVSRIHHGGVVPILDYGMLHQAPFQVLELIDGISVAKALALGVERGAPMPLCVATHIATEVAHALHVVHETRNVDGTSCGIVHRDIKPSNILLSRTGDVRVVDFGVAFAFDRLTKTTGFAPKGTSGYMAPEQMLGTPVDRRADVFALGCTLHTMVAHQSPFNTRERLLQLFGVDEIVLSETLPKDLHAIIARAVQRHPSARHASALEMSRALGRALSQRLEVDARSALLSWLTPLLPPRRAPSTNQVTETWQTADFMRDVRTVTGVR